MSNNQPPWWHHQEINVGWPHRKGIDRKRGDPVRNKQMYPDQVKDQYPEVLISRGFLVDTDYGRDWSSEPPSWEYEPADSILVRPIVKWFGRAGK